MTGFSAAARAAAAAAASDLSKHPHGAGGRFASTGRSALENEPFHGGSTVAAPSGRGKVTGVRGDDYIHVHVTANPKRRGNANYERFKHFRNGGTVQQYVDAVAAMGHDRRGALGDIMHDVRKGYLTVVDKAAAERAIAAAGGDVDKGLADAIAKLPKAGGVPAVPAARKAPLDPATTPAAAAPSRHAIGGTIYSGDHVLHVSRRLGGGAGVAGIRDGDTLDQAHGRYTAMGMTPAQADGAVSALAQSPGVGLRPPGSVSTARQEAETEAAAGPGTHTIGGRQYSGDHVLRDSSGYMQPAMVRAGVRDGDTLDQAHGRLLAAGHTPARARRMVDDYVVRGRNGLQPPDPGARATAPRDESETTLSGVARDDTPPGDVPKPGTPEREFHDGILKAAGNFGPNASARINYDRYGDPAGFTVSTGSSGDSITRGIDVRAKTVNHAFFSIVDQSKRGTGAAKRFLADSVEAYKEIGITTVKVHANIDVGGYAWAKYGFKPRPDTVVSLTEQVNSRLQDLKYVPDSGLTEETESAVRTVLASGDFHALSDVTTPVRAYGASEDMPLGKHLLLGTDWYGTLDLTDPASMARFTAYATPKPKD